LIAKLERVMKTICAVAALNRMTQSVPPCIVAIARYALNGLVRLFTEKHGLKGVGVRKRKAQRTRRLAFATLKLTAD
jgi:hypothetical protein